LRVQVPERVVGQRRQAGDRIVARQVGGFGVAHVAGRLQAHPRRGRSEVTSLIKAQVEPVHLMPGGTQERDEHGPDVATVTGDEDPHTYLHRRWVSRGGTVPMYSMICDGRALIRRRPGRLRGPGRSHARATRNPLSAGTPSQVAKSCCFAVYAVYLGITGTGSKVTYVRVNPRGTMR